MKQHIPKLGDIVWTDFDPAAGPEQKGKRPALVAPITSRVRGHAFEVPVQGQKVSGVILCQLMKTLDCIDRGVSFVEEAPDSVVADVLARVRTITS